MENFRHPWRHRVLTEGVHASLISPAIGFLIVLCLTQSGSLFSSDAWNNITFTAGEVKNPRRNIPLSLAIGTALVILLYLLANLAYLAVLPFDQIQHAASDRVASTMFQSIFPTLGAKLISWAIMFSVFGCMNGLILSGARAYYAMARDGLFFARAGTLNRASVPGFSLSLQAVWSILIVLVRVYDPQTSTYGNLYSNLFEYVIAAALFFYILSIAGIFRLRRIWPDIPRPYAAIGYPIVPCIYIAGASMILLTLLFYRSSTTLPGAVIVLTGVPAYFLFKRFGMTATNDEQHEP